MSQPTPNYFCVHTGFFRNDRTLALRRRIGDLAFCVMPMIWSWAGESQMDGKVGHLDDRAFQEIFEGCHLKLPLARVKKIVAAIHGVGFIQRGRLHSWDLFNRQFTEFKERREIKRNAAFERWRTKVEAPYPAQQTHETNGEIPKQTPTQKLWLIDEALKNAKGKAKRELERKRDALLDEHTGVDRSEKASPAPAAPTPTRSKSRAELAAEKLSMARQKLADTPDMLTEENIRVLIEAGDKLPAPVAKKFSRWIGLLTGAEEFTGNPVPG